MSIAQSLYEGVEVGTGEPVGLITYMRTDSVRVSDDAVLECRAFIEKRYGAEALPAKPIVYKTKKQNVQDAHEAIRPTSMELTPERLRPHLRDDQFKLYKLIWDRFVACQMNPAVYDQTSVEIEAKAGPRTYGLRASGSVLKVPGWKAVYGATAAPLAGEEDSAEASAEETPEEGLLPELTEGEALAIVAPPGVQSDHKQPEPPPYYNEASLVKKLEEEGIGRPSTYAEILSKVQARDYVVKVGGKLVPSPLGKLVIEKLVADHFDLADIGFTRKLEEDLDAVSEARAKRLDVLAPFHERLTKQIAHALENKAKWWPEPEAIGEACPKCGKDLMKRWGRNGPFIGCPGYPECDYTRNVASGIGESDEQLAHQPTLTDYKCDKCQSPMMKRWGKNGWFLGCSTFPKCKGTRNLPLGVNCPKCGGEIVEIRPRGRGRPFYGCSNYSTEAKCDFKVWQRPVSEACPKCGWTFLLKVGGKKAPVLKCANETCDYERPDETVTPDGEDGAPPPTPPTPALGATGTEDGSPAGP